ncbi:MAG: hypothetical protein DRP84_08570 [Spirochaetes bacterium]|nr:MAG: hypothetical protein DRP84_08570 [Spirochaetota bacterium]
MNLRCPSCKSDKIVCLGQIPVGRFLSQFLSGGNLYCCKSCHLYFRWPHLSQKQLNILYGKENINNWQAKLGQRKDWQIAVDWLNTKLIKGKILDIGCFNGEFLNYLGDKWQRYGIEINEIAAQKAKEKGVKVIADDFEEIDKLSSQFDAVTAFDVIEHTQNPKRFLWQMVKATRPGGVIIVASGNTDAPSWRFLGSRYYYCAMAEHISFINEAWCHKVAQELNLIIKNMKKFSHRESNFTRKILDLGLNTIYRFAPNIVGMIRAYGFGGIDVRRDKRLRQFPPSWLSAKDHLIVLFRKEY